MYIYNQPWLWIRTVIISYWDRNLLVTFFVVDDMVVEVVFCIFGSSHVPEVMGIVVFCGKGVIFSLKKGWVSCSDVDVIFRVSSFSSFSLLMKTSFGLLARLWQILKLFFWDCGRVAGFFGWQGNWIGWLFFLLSLNRSGKWAYFFFWHWGPVSSGAFFGFAMMFFFGWVTSMKIPFSDGTRGRKFPSAFWRSCLSDSRAPPSAQR